METMHCWYSGRLQHQVALVPISCRPSPDCLGNLRNDLMCPTYDVLRQQMMEIWHYLLALMEIWHYLRAGNHWKLYDHAVSDPHQH